MAEFGVSAVQPLVVSDGSQLVGGLGEVGMIVATGVLRCEWWLTINALFVWKHASVALRSN